MLNIVLHEPEMPANTGNIGRTCVAAGARLHLIEPLGFQINEKQLKRAGLDYWDKLDVTIYDDFNDFLEKNPDAKIYMATTKSKQKYTTTIVQFMCVSAELLVAIVMRSIMHYLSMVTKWFLLVIYKVCYR